MIVQHLHQNYCAQNWGLVQDFIKSAAEQGDDYSAEQIKIYVLSGIWLLLVITDSEKQVHGALTVAFENGANHRTACITSLGGKDVVTQELFDQVCAIVKNLGATRIHCYARDSAARLYTQVGFSKKSTLMECKL
jgi:hypothetical protein